MAISFANIFLNTNLVGTAYGAANSNTIQIDNMILPEDIGIPGETQGDQCRAIEETYQKYKQLYLDQVLEKAVDAMEEGTLDHRGIEGATKKVNEAWEKLGEWRVKERSFHDCDEHDNRKTICKAVEESHKALMKKAQNKLEAFQQTNPVEAQRKYELEVAELERTHTINIQDLECEK